MDALKSKNDVKIHLETVEGITQRECDHEERQQEEGVPRQNELQQFRDVVDDVDMLAHFISVLVPACEPQGQSQPLRLSPFHVRTVFRRQHDSKHLQNIYDV